MDHPEERLFRDNGDINLRKAFSIAFQRKAFWVIGLFLGLGITFWVGILDVPIHSAQLRIRPLDSDERIRISQVMNVKAAFLQRAFGHEANSDLNYYMGTILSVQAIERAIKKHNLAQVLFPELWDEERQEWRPPEDVAGPIERGQDFLNGKIGRHLYMKPDDPAFVADYLADKLWVERDDWLFYRRVIRVRVELERPEAALAALQALHQETLAIMHENKLRSAENMLRIARDNYAAESDVKSKAFLMERIIFQEKRLALLRTASYPMVQVIDDPGFPYLPRFVNVFILLIGGLVVGQLAMVALNFLLYFIACGRARQRQFYSS